MAHLGVAVVGESVTGDAVGAEYQVDTLFLSLLDDVEGKVEFIVFAERVADSSTLSLSKSLCHTTAEDEVVHLVHEVLDDTDLGRHL